MPIASPATPELREAISRKPRYGTPCNGCGACCMVTLCKLGRSVYGFELGRCPALQKLTDGAYGCGLATVRRSALLRDAAALLIGAGDGCDARFNGEPRDEAFAERLDRRDEADADVLRAALRLWGAP